MSLELSRILYYYTAELAVLSLCLSLGYVFGFSQKLSKGFKIMFYYLIWCLSVELTSKFVLKYNENSTYFSYVDFVYVMVECFLLYAFLLKVVFKTGQVWFVLGYTFMAGFVLANSLIFTELRPYVFVIVGIINSLVLLFSLYTISRKNHAKVFYLLPEVIICLAYLVAVLANLFIHLLLPSLREYSDIIVNQAIIVINLTSVAYYLFIAYGLKKSVR